MLMQKISLFFLLLLLFSFSKKKELFAQNKLPPGFVYLSNYVPGFKLDLRYATKHNFVGKAIKGYQKESCIVTENCAKQLQKLNNDLKKYDLTILIYDAYRPQKAVNHFVRWAKKKEDTLMKSEFYPNVAKKDLFKKGFIASKSRHSSGSTVDITLYSLKYNEILDMGSPYDFFGEKSFVNYQNLTKEQKYNRLFLQRIMQKYGFRSYPKEWWHFTLRNEPYRNHYFNFNVK